MFLKSLFARKTAIDAGPKLRRLMDLTLPNRPVCDDSRRDNRYNRTLPALICPWLDNQPVLSLATFGISQDFSDSGVRVIFLSPPEYDRFIVSFQFKLEEVTERFHFICEVRDIRSFAPGMKSVGLLVTELADERALPLNVKASLESLMAEHLSAEH